MPGPADERIRRFLARQAEAAVAAEKERQEENAREQERKIKTDRIQKKWVADTHVINAILRELKSKMVPIEYDLNFQDVGPSHNGVAGGIIVGRFGGEDVHLALEVKDNGLIEPHEKGSKVGFTRIIATAAKISVLTANTGEYEALILDLLGVD